jgi:hypothetical protein
MNIVWHILACVMCHACVSMFCLFSFYVHGPCYHTDRCRVCVRVAMSHVCVLIGSVRLHALYAFAISRFNCMSRMCDDGVHTVF